MDFFQLDLSSFIFYNHEASWQQPLGSSGMNQARSKK